MNDNMSMSMAFIARSATALQGFGFSGGQLGLGAYPAIYSRGRLWPEGEAPWIRFLSATRSPMAANREMDGAE